jgi:type III pantothenate kinase
MQLLIDIGNTRIKWAVDSDGLKPTKALPHAELDSDALRVEILETLPSKPRRVVIANVAGPAIAERLTSAIRSQWGLEPEFIQASAAAVHIRNGYDNPQQLGVDRWLAAIGAFEMARGPVCVASIGTAMTVDAVDASGQHLGGIIVPGPDLAISSLLTNTSDLALRSQTGNASAALFANNTLGALRQGTAHALAAVIERACTDLGTRAQEEPLLVITGGASERVTGALRIPFRVVPDIVLRGLAAVAKT